MSQHTPPSWVTTLSEASSADHWPPRNGAPYDWSIPTQEAYYDERDQDFVGEFERARRQLDYSYHRHPATKRQQLQDSILSQVVKHHPTSAKQPNHVRPWLILSAGPMGVGKSYVLSKLHSAGYFPLNHFLKIDPDMIKSEIPENAGYMEANPETAATLLHGESSQMADILFQHGLHFSLDMLVDGSLRNVDWYRDLITNAIRKNHPQYRIAILHVTAEADTIRQRARQRAITSGRAVPTDLLEESIRQVPESVQQLGPLVDLVYTISNNEGEAMKLIDSMHKRSKNNGDALEGGGEGPSEPSLSWSDFAQSWRHDPHDPLQEVDHDDDHALVCDMENAWTDSKTQQIAQGAWGRSYPNFCSRCSITCDGVCGKCVHDKHLCACEICKKSRK